MEGIERVALAAVSVQGKDEEAPELLAQGVDREQGLELADRSLLRTGGEERLDTTLLCFESALLESRGLGQQRRSLRQPRERRTPPEPEGVVEDSHGQMRILQ